MRKLKLQVQISIDGYIAGLNGEMDWMVWDWDQELKNYIIALTEPVDCIVLGRKLADGFIPHWAAHPEMEGADKINSTKKIVFTKTLDRSVWDNTILAKGDITEEINELKKQDGKDIIAYGGANFVSALIKEGLIDEFHLLINPMAIGTGMPIFKALTAKQEFTLKNVKQFDCGIALLHYEPKQK